MGIFSQSPLGQGAVTPIPEEEDRVLEKLAIKVVEWRMAPAAIISLESFKPMNYIASQGMVFMGPMLEPVLEMFFNFREYDILRQAMERRANVENLIQKIERYDAVAYQRDKMIKEYYKTERKKWTWYQRWLGIRQPRVEYPEHIKNFDWKKAAGVREVNSPDSDTNSI